MSEPIAAGARKDGSGPSRQGPRPVADQRSPPADGLKGVRSAFGRSRVRTLVLLRWMAIGGQTATVLAVRFLLDFDLPLASCLAAIGASAWLNVALTAMFPPQRLATQAEAAAQLSFDILQLAALIWLTGGLQNPFLMLLLAPVTVGASLLRPGWTIILVLLALACAGGMSLHAQPLPWKAGETLQLPILYQAGQFAAVTVGLFFFAISAWRTGRDEERLVSALDAVQAVLAREQQLSALGALAAATAHELGTPLATIHLVARELERDPGAHPAHREDVHLIAEQAERCRAILRQLGERRQATDAALGRTPLSSLIEEAAEPHRSAGRTITFRSAPLPAREGAPEDPDAARAPMVVRRPEILHALGAFIENAASFAASRVEVSARWSREEVRIYVTDDGPGFAPSVLSKLGEPYFSERTVEQRGGGLGLGFFIATTLLERTGARVAPYNRAAPARGAVVRISWPRQAIEAPPGWAE